ncbi:hypothetical protein HMPREF0682_1832 [Propionibacterium acidifaciens F0233]|uniref:Uncharacterized protein n=1 Tax=Propionibacterium acidifaciens F0233 TaxID=553198 RepID=U2S5A5_9ACTN|nr:hypothetical protein HMPREF0682_1832 [Propionibacterium acidifaciens F0233]
MPPARGARKTELVPGKLGPATGDRPSARRLTTGRAPQDKEELIDE